MVLRPKERSYDKIDLSIKHLSTSLNFRADSYKPKSMLKPRIGDKLSITTESNVGDNRYYIYIHDPKFDRKTAIKLNNSK